MEFYASLVPEKQFLKPSEDKPGLPSWEQSIRAGPVVNNTFCLLSLQSDVDNDLVGDSCDTNQDRYGTPPGYMETGGNLGAVGIVRALHWQGAPGSVDGSGTTETVGPPLLRATVPP